MGRLAIAVIACLARFEWTRTARVSDLSLKHSTVYSATGKLGGDAIPKDLIFVGWHGSRRGGFGMKFAKGHMQPKVPLDFNDTQTDEEMKLHVERYKRGQHLDTGFPIENLPELGEGFYVAMDKSFRGKTYFQIENESSAVMHWNHTLLTWQAINHPRYVVPPGRTETSALETAQKFGNCLFDLGNCVFQVWVSWSAFESMIGKVVYYEDHDTAWQTAGSQIEDGTQYKKMMEADYVIAHHELHNLSCIQIKFNSFGYNDPFQHLFLTPFSPTSKL